LGLDEAGVPALAVVAGLLVPVAVSGALAVLSYRVVERPFLERKGDSRPGAPVKRAWSDGAPAVELSPLV
jgi:peptidoglycan/LPS O-acetylase OafA/YrhL